MRILIFFVYSTFASYCYSQSQLHSPKVRFAIETYAFLKGQNFALQMIARQFPVLKKEVAETGNDSKIFQEAQQNIESFLDSELDNSEFKILKDQISSLLKEQFENPIEREKYARDFLEKVKMRSRFIEDSLISKGILSFAYENAPHQEFMDGHIIIYTTKGNPKAEQADLKLPIPKSWKAEEATMSETVQQFTSYDGKGIEKIIIVVHDVDCNQKLNVSSINEMIAPEAKLIRTEPVIIAGKNGMMVEVEESLISGNEKMKIRMLQFMFVQKGKLYCLQGSIGPAEVSKNLEPQLKKYEPLFRLVASGARLDN